MICPEKVKDPLNGNNSSVIDSQGQSEIVDRNSTRTLKENLSSVAELESENQGLPSSETVKVSCQFSNHSSTPISQDPNIDQDEGREVCIRTNDPRSEDAIISARQLPATVSVSVPGDFDTSGSKTTQENLSPFSLNRKAEFSTPPDHGTIPMTKSFSKNLKETNTPSPEKRSIETDLESTLTKKSRKTPESLLGKPMIGIESYSNLSPLAAVKASYKSPTNLQFQVPKAAIQKIEETESLNRPPTPGKRKRSNKSSESKSICDPCLSNLSTSPAFNIVHKPSTNIQMHGIEVAVQSDDSPAEKNRSISFQDGSADSNSLVESNNPDELLQISSFFTPMKKLEFTISNESADLSSANSYLKQKQKGSRSILNTSDEEALANFSSEKADKPMIKPPMTLKGSSLIRTDDVSGEQRDRLPTLDVLFDAMQLYVSASEMESIVDTFKLKDEISDSIFAPASKPQNSVAAEFESSTIVKKLQDSASLKETQASSNGADSAIEIQVSEASQSRPLILNPHLYSSCHLPRRRTKSTDASFHMIEFERSFKTMRSDHNPSDKSTIQSTLVTESRSQPKNMLMSRNQESHQRSLSDRTIASKYSSESHQSNILLSRFPRSQSEESSDSCSAGMHRRYVSDETILCTKLTEDESRQNQHNSILRAESKETVTPKTRKKRIPRATCVVQPLINRISSRSALNTPSVMNNLLSTPRNHHEVRSNINPPYINVVEGQASSSSYHPLVQSFFPTSRNEPAIRENEINSRMLGGESSIMTSQPLHTDDASSDDQSSASSSASLNDLLDSLIDLQSNASSDEHQEQHDSSHVDKHPEYVAAAQRLLQMVLKEMMVHNRENSLWNSFEESFRLIPVSCPLGLIAKLVRYLTEKAYYLCDTLQLFPYDQIELSNISIYGRLILIVVNTIVFNLTMRSSRNFDVLISNYSLFTSLFSTFYSILNIFNVESIEDESSRNRIKTLRKMVHGLLLQVRMAFRILLMYVGENASESMKRIYEIGLSEEDKMYLRYGN